MKRRLICLTAAAALTIIGGTGCEAVRKARTEREMREFWGDGYDNAKAEMEAAQFTAWVLSWEDGPPVHVTDPAQLRITTRP